MRTVTFKVPMDFVERQDRRWDDGKSGYSSRGNMDFEIWEYILEKSYLVKKATRWRNDFLYGGYAYDNKHLTPPDVKKYFEFTEDQYYRALDSIDRGELHRFNFWTSNFWNRANVLRAGDKIKIKNLGWIDAETLWRRMRRSQYNSGYYIPKEDLIPWLEDVPFLNNVEPDSFLNRFLWSKKRDEYDESLQKDKEYLETL